MSKEMLKNTPVGKKIFSVINSTVVNLRELADDIGTFTDKIKTHILNDKYVNTWLSRVLLLVSFLPSK